MNSSTKSPTQSNKIIFSPEVQLAIDQVLQSNDPLDAADFNPIDYINQLFPNEQSLTTIEDVISKIECEITVIDDNIRDVVRGQTNTTLDGQLALDEAQKVINQLFLHIHDIKIRAEKTEEMVKEITRDIKQLDCAKKNLTIAITTLNHLHMLVGGVESLNKLIEKRLYGEILNPLQAITEVNQHFQQFGDIEQIKNLSNSVQQIQNILAQQITEDFHSAFSPTATSSASSSASSTKIPLSLLTDACKVVSVIDPKVKRDLLKWFLSLQLEEYIQLFHENQDIAWLDKIDKRYAWLKRHLLDFEDKYGQIFPNDWEISERITVQFCNITNIELTKIMLKRRNEIDVKLLLFAITKTQQFEQLLTKRFNGITINEMKTSITNSNDNDNIEKQNGFYNLIGECFKIHLDIYTESIDRNLTELTERFIQQSKQPFNPIESKSTVFPSCADLFVFYKKCMIQCTQLSNGKPMYDLAMIFKKYLREYAIKILESNIPKMTTTQNSLGTSMSLLTRDLQNLSTAAGQVIHNFLKEGDAPRFNKDELIRICCVLTTAEYCLETIQQLEDKLKEKIHIQYIDKIDLSEEQDIYHRIISNCIQLLVQDLENACDQSLQIMTKIQWQNIQNVGDQSGFVNTIIINFKTTIPIIRDNLSTSRKYYTQFCHKFVNTFIPKYINTLFKCKLLTTSASSTTTTTSASTITSSATTTISSSSSISSSSLSQSDQTTNNILGCEQLLLDTHSIKTVLLDLPSIGSLVNRKAPISYTKFVVKGMTRAELIIKIVMTPIIQLNNIFNNQVIKLLPDITIQEYQKIMDMKGLKRTEQMNLIDIFKKIIPSSVTASTSTSLPLYTMQHHTSINDNQILHEQNIDNNNMIQIMKFDNQEHEQQQQQNTILNDNNTINIDNDKLIKSNMENSIQTERSHIKRLENLIKKRLP